jgi:hypothetical protein
VSILRTVDSVLSIDVTLEMCFTVGGVQRKSPAARLAWALSEVLQAQPDDLGVCARFGGRIAAVHPEAGGTWLCVQPEEDGANACTCADESI